MKNFIERLEEAKYTKHINCFRGGYNSALTDVINLYNELHPSTEIIAPEPEKQAKEGSFKVRVTNAESNKWYSHSIGKEFEVKNHSTDERWYCVVGVDYTLHCILKSDCEIIPETTKPPLGLMPKKIHDEQVNKERLNEVCGAITRYYNAGLKINLEWVEEYNELVSKNVQNL